MRRKYWLSLYSGKNWEEFLDNGGTVTGFKQNRAKTVDKISIGDYLICYVTGISVFIAILEVKSKSFIDTTIIWEDELFPCRLKVEVLYKLAPNTAIPVKSLRDSLSIFKDIPIGGSWTGFFRGAPRAFSENDGKMILNLIRKTVDNPAIHEIDEKKYYKSAKVYSSKDMEVTIPDDTDNDNIDKIKNSKRNDNEKSEVTHKEIQWTLLNLGARMGYGVWVARNDKNNSFNNNEFNKIPKLVKDIPRQFDEATNRTIEMIDVLWLQGDAIIAAFEVEHTTTIYSGLLRMSDLISMQPNLKINLYIVAPDERRGKVINEINRATFVKLKPPLHSICRFIPYTQLLDNVSKFDGMLHCLNINFIEEISESCEVTI